MTNKNFSEQLPVDQTDVDGVYYDRKAANFYCFDVRDGGETVAFVDAFTGECEEEISAEAFLELRVERDFEEVPNAVVEHPSDVLEEFMFDAVSALNGGALATQYNPTELDFALAACNLTLGEHHFNSGDEQ